MSHRLTACALAAILAGLPALAQDDLVTRDRVGPGDAARGRPAHRRGGLRGSPVRWRANRGTTFDWLASYWALGSSWWTRRVSPAFHEGENREKFLQAIGFYEDLVESDAAPSRVTSITTYDDSLAAGASGSTAMFIGGNRMCAQLQATLLPEESANWASEHRRDGPASRRCVPAGDRLRARGVPGAAANCHQCPYVRRNQGLAGPSSLPSRWRSSH